MAGQGETRPGTGAGNTPPAAIPGADKDLSPMIDTIVWVLVSSSGIMCFYGCGVSG